MHTHISTVSLQKLCTSLSRLAFQDTLPLRSGLWRIFMFGLLMLLLVVVLLIRISACCFADLIAFSLVIMKLLNLR